MRPAVGVGDDVLAAQQQRPAGADDDIGVLDAVRHAATPRSASQRRANRSSSPRQVSAPNTTSGAWAGLLGDQRAADGADGELFVHGIGLDVLVVIGDHLGREPEPVEPLRHPPRRQRAGRLERRQMAERRAVQPAMQPNSDIALFCASTSTGTSSMYAP